MPYCLVIVPSRDHPPSSYFLQYPLLVILVPNQVIPSADGSSVCTQPPMVPIGPKVSVGETGCCKSGVACTRLCCWGRGDAARQLKG